MKTISTTLFLLIIILITGCKDDEAEQEPVRFVNTFSMKVNGSDWQPTLIGGDECQTAFRGEKFSLGDTDYYTIRAYKDPDVNADVEKSENYLELQIKDVAGPRTHSVSDLWTERFGAYAWFRVRLEDGSYKSYCSMPGKKSVTVIVDKLIPVEWSDYSIGISGSFSGEVYNEEDPTDVMTIEGGTFYFERINWSSYNQCSPPKWE